MSLKSTSLIKSKTTQLSNRGLITTMYSSLKRNNRKIRCIPRVQFKKKSIPKRSNRVVIFPFNNTSIKGSLRVQRIKRKLNLPHLQRNPHSYVSKNHFISNLIIRSISNQVIFKNTLLPRLNSSRKFFHLYLIKRMANINPKHRFFNYY